MLTYAVDSLASKAQETDSIKIVFLMIKIIAGKILNNTNNKA